MAKLGKFKTNENLEIEGVWVAFAEGIEFRIARARNPRSDEVTFQLQQEHEYAIKSKMLSVEKQRELYRRVLSQAILVDWRNIEDDNGNPIPYSAEEAYRVLTEYPEIRRFVMDVSEDISHFRGAQEKEAEGNSEPHSDGS